jgi:hypothetical protein
MANGECLTSSGPSVVMSLEGGDEESPTNAGNGEVKSSSGSGAARRREAKKAAIGGKSGVFWRPHQKTCRVDWLDLIIFVYRLPLLRPEV